MLTTALRGLMKFLDANRAVFRERLSEESPEWVPDWVDDRVFSKGFTAAQSFLADVSLDSDHELRHAFDSTAQPGRAAAQRPGTDRQDRAGQGRTADHPQVREWLSTLWLRGKALVVDGANDPTSDLRRGVERLVVRAGEVLRDDTQVSARVEEALQRVAGHVVSHYGSRRDSGDLVHRPALGLRGDRRAGSSCRSGATCSSSASTAPSSARWPAC